MKYLLLILILTSCANDCKDRLDFEMSRKILAQSEASGRLVDECLRHNETVQMEYGKLFAEAAREIEIRDQIIDSLSYELSRSNR